MGSLWGQEAGEGFLPTEALKGLLCTCEAGRPWEVRGAWQGGAESPDTCFLLCTQEQAQGPARRCPDRRCPQRGLSETTESFLSCTDKLLERLRGA